MYKLTTLTLSQDICEAVIKSDLQTIQRYYDEYGKRLVEAKDGGSRNLVWYASCYGNIELLNDLLKKQFQFSFEDVNAIASRGSLHPESSARPMPRGQEYFIWALEHFPRFADLILK